jgi:hypothetical protein
MWRLWDCATLCATIDRSAKTPPTRYEKMSDPQSNLTRKLGPGGWITILVLLGFLVGALAYAVHGWNSVGAVGIPLTGWIFLVAGVVLTLLIGGGLMALMFYSSRKGRDI